MEAGWLGPFTVAAAVDVKQQEKGEEEAGYTRCISSGYESPVDIRQKLAPRE
jgi:hypothetical protein